MPQGVDGERPCARWEQRGGGPRGALPSGLDRCPQAVGHLSPQAEVAGAARVSKGRPWGGLCFISCLFPQMTAAQLTYLLWGSKRWWN